MQPSRLGRGSKPRLLISVVAWLSNRDEALESEELKDIRLPLAAFLSLDHEERIRLLAAELDRKAGAWVPEDVGRELFELQQVRNVVVHRAGLADRRFVENCPSWNLRVGDPVKLDHHRYGRFFAAVVWYVVVVENRV